MQQKTFTEVIDVSQSDMGTRVEGKINLYQSVPYPVSSVDFRMAYTLHQTEADVSKFIRPALVNFDLMGHEDTVGTISNISAIAPSITTYSGSATGTIDATTSTEAVSMTSGNTGTVSQFEYVYSQPMMKSYSYQLANPQLLRGDLNYVVDYSESTGASGSTIGGQVILQASFKGTENYG